MTAGLHQCAHDKEGTFILKGQTAAYSLDDEQSKKKKENRKKPSPITTITRPMHKRVALSRRSAAV